MGTPRVSYILPSPHEARPHRPRERQFDGRRLPVERRTRDRLRARRRVRRRHPRGAARAAHRRLSAGRSRAVARVRRRAARRARPLCAGDGAARVRVRDRPRGRARLEPLQRRGARARGPGLGLRAEGEAPPLQRVLRGADARTRVGGPLRHPRGSALRRSRSSTSTSAPSPSRCARTAGPPTDRCAGARMRAPRSS